MSKPEKPNETADKSTPANDESVEELTAEELEKVAGGAKHIGGTKYEDLTVNLGTGMSKVEADLPKT